MHFEERRSKPDNMRIAGRVKTLCEAQVRDGFEDIRLPLAIVSKQCIDAVAESKAAERMVSKIRQSDARNVHPAPSQNNTAAPLWAGPPRHIGFTSCTQLFKRTGITSIITSSCPFCSTGDTMPARVGVLNLKTTFSES